MKLTHLFVGTHPESGAPTIELAFDEGSTMRLVLDPAHADAIARRLRQCIDGTAKRVLEIEFDVFVEQAKDTVEDPHPDRKRASR